MYACEQMIQFPIIIGFSLRLPLNYKKWFYEKWLQNAIKLSTFIMIEHHLLTGPHHLDVPGGHAQSECFAKLLFYNLQLWLNHFILV